MLTLATAIFCGISTAAGGGVSLGPDVPMGVGVTMSLLLGFRLNVSYQRWWEGRLLWGDVTVSTRSLMTLLSSAPPRATPPPGGGVLPPTAAQQAAGWLLAFATCLKRRLRDQPSELDSESPAARLLGAAAAAASSARRTRRSTPSARCAPRSPPPARLDLTSSRASS